MSLYNELPIDFLLKFYQEIQRNINKGIYSKAMQHELRLIEKSLVARKQKLNHLSNQLKESINNK